MGWDGTKVCVEQHLPQKSEIGNIRSQNKFAYKPEADFVNIVVGQLLAVTDRCLHTSLRNSTSKFLWCFHRVGYRNGIFQKAVARIVRRHPYYLRQLEAGLATFTAEFLVSWHGSLTDL